MHDGFVMILHYCDKLVENKFKILQYWNKCFNFVKKTN